MLGRASFLIAVFEWYFLLRSSIGTRPGARKVDTHAVFVVGTRVPSRGQPSSRLEHRVVLSFS
jgi:hypothetical protein